MRFIYISIALIGFLLLMGCDAQTKSSVEDNHAYYSLNDNLQDIGNILNEHDIVILGESTHWSADITEEKINIIEYLAQHHDFNKFFLETPDSEFNYYKDSGLPMIDGVNTQYHQEIFSSFIEGEHDNIQAFPMDWTPLFTGNNASAVSILEENITGEISEFNQDLAGEFKRSEYALRDWFSRGMFQNQSVGHFEREIDVYEEIQKEDFFKELPEPSQNYITSKQENIKDYIEKINFDNAQIDYYDQREIGMADKVLSQLEDGDKAIVWVANGHSNYDVSNIEHTNEVFLSERRDERTESLGALLRESNHSVYNVGLYYNQADNYKLLPEDYEAPRKTGDDTLEGYIGDRVQDDIFIDFETSDFIEEKLYTAYVMGAYDYKMIPQEQYDGLIYLDHLKE